VVDLRTVDDVEDMHGAIGFVDPVDDPVGAAAGSVTARQRAEQGFADAVGVDRQGGFAEFQHGGSNRLGLPLRDGPVPLLGLSAHVPVARRRARSCRTVARSACRGCLSS